MIRAVSEQQYVREMPTMCVVCNSWIIPGQPAHIVLPDHGWAHAYHHDG